MGFHPMCHPCAQVCQSWPYPSGYNSATAIGRSWVQTTVGSICRAVGRIRDTTGQFLFLFFLLFFFFALTLSPLLGIPENAGVM